jgi:quercetin dioxygenase-like cupin family protein
MKTLGFMTVGALFALAAGPAPRPITFLPAPDVAAAFAKGRPLVEVENYKVHASRREAPGEVEIHTRDTDIIYVLTGTATFVTGGTIVGGRETAPEEIRGPSVEGGDTRTLKPGDVVIVPGGTPHWFKEVPGPMTYYVVKVRAEGGR